MTRLLGLMLALAVPLGGVMAEAPLANHPEARAFSESADSRRDLDAALAAALVDGRRVLVVMGANWCHDSRALAGWFATPRFATMLERRAPASPRRRRSARNAESVPGPMVPSSAISG